MMPAGEAVTPAMTEGHTALNSGHNKAFSLLPNMGTECALAHQRAEKKAPKNITSEKMNQLETRLIKSDEELRSQQTNLQQERQMKDQKDTENRKLFQRLQESIAI